MNRISTAILLFAALLTSACATVGGMQNAPLDAGTARVFQAPFDSTLQAAREAMVESGFRIEVNGEVEPGTWIIVGTTGMSFVSHGELVRVAVARQEERTTRVTVHTRLKMATNIFAENDYSETIFSRMAWKLR
jgi:hypothetical protein